jgi:hypothetical protein
MNGDVFRFCALASTFFKLHTGDLVTIHDRINGAQAFQHINTGINCHLADCSIKFKAWRRSAVIWEIATGPREVKLLAKSGSSKSFIAGATLKPRRKTQFVEFCHCPGSQSVTARLIPGEGFRINE